MDLPFLMKIINSGRNGTQQSFPQRKPTIKKETFMKTNFGVFWEDLLIAFKLDTKYHSLIW